jgi:hypothetical protein
MTQIMVGNASLLSVIYLAAGACIEGWRRLHPSPGVDRLSLALEALPARALELLGAMGALREYYVYGKISELWVRVIFGTTVIAIIFALAILLGMAMWTVRRLWEWPAARP